MPDLRIDRQERRIGLRPLLAQRRQHDVHHRVEALQHLQQRRVEAAGRVALRRRHELVFEAERVEEGAQPRVVVLAERRMRAERVRHLGQRLAEMLRQHLLVRHVVGHLAEPIHVVGERDQPRLDLVVGEHAEGVAHHGGARHLAEGADMRQARTGRSRSRRSPRPSAAFFRRATILRASSNGQALDCSARSRNEAAVSVTDIMLSGRGLS